MPDRTLALDHLPVELLYEIYSFALSSAFPLTSKYIYTVFKTAPSSIHGDFLIDSYNAQSQKSATARAFGFISQALRYPICTIPVLSSVFHNPRCPRIPMRGNHDFMPTVLPRRLFRNLSPRHHGSWTDTDEPLPFLRFLYTHPRIPPIATNSHDGYALTRAVFADHVPLIRFLLANEASPGCRDNIAVMVAIRKRNLPLVRMLIERDWTGPVDSLEMKPKRRKKLLFAGGPGGDDGTEPGGSEGSHTASSDASGSSSGGGGSTLGKRRKLGDRVKTDSIMLREAVKGDARDIVDYLMKEKGVSPDMQTVLLMQSM
ncbi:uncharacterized protein BXZ73DRAFT_86588 [Epithele typhae]|uniref:uncharacterized protein n=1 Tax=Epithele typhae TaxID=378194 RepID=UPI002007AFEF|nr:uncharacterized protein BXZ73DRAFT_86588 [Epithele typhae]KAH9945003.1 hypothetical protein BXZ73DRAFT_86588 [Epithele typhae]